MEVKAEVNGTPLPQRAPKNNAPGNQQQDVDSGVPEKKPRFGGNDRGGGGGGPVGGGGRNDANKAGQGGQGGGNRGNRFRGGGGRGRNQRDGDGGGGGGYDRRGDRNDDRNDRRGGGMGMGGGRKGDEYMIGSKLKQLQGPTHELAPIDAEETKFSGRNRLYLGNLTNDINEEELRELFKPYGEISEAFINAEKNFAFLKVDYHANAERAKRELDGQMRKNRALRIRFAPNATIIRVKNLTQYVSNELLFKSFEIFGPVERAVIIVDDRGKPTGEGIVEFARKSGAMAAIRYCTEKCFFLTASLRPCVVETFEINDDTDGMPDKSMNKKTQEFFKSRQVGPRFADQGSFEHEYGTRWKQLHELFKQKHEALKRELVMEEEKLEAQMEFARYEHETELLREQLRLREQDRERTKMEWEMKERQAEEIRNRDEENMRRQQEDMAMRMNRQDEELRRRQQENTLFMQAQQLNSLLDQQEINQGGNSNAGNMNMGGNNGGNNRQGRNFDFGDLLNNFDVQGNQLGGNQDQGFMAFDIGQNKPNRFDDGQTGGNGGAMNQRGGGGNDRQWNDRRGGGGGGGGGNGGDFQNNKRRRF